MTGRNAEHPACYGRLDQVFPKGEDGLRHSPESCLVCFYKTECLRTALEGRDGLAAREEINDRAYASGTITFFQRWSRKKSLGRRLKKDRRRQ